VSVIQVGGEGVKGTDTMGRVAATAKIENMGHFALVERGLIRANQAPCIELPNVLVDSSAQSLCMPAKLIQQLEPMPSWSGTERIGTELAPRRVYGAVRLTVQGRECTSDVVKVPDDHPVLTGRIPLQLLDFVIDPVGLSLIGNPARGGEQRIELYLKF
jgi:hypothetical protein